jgi:hypothetical protein
MNGNYQFRKKQTESGVLHCPFHSSVCEKGGGSPHKNSVETMQNMTFNKSNLISG